MVNGYDNTIFFFSNCAVTRTLVHILYNMLFVLRRKVVNYRLFTNNREFASVREDEVHWGVGDVRMCVTEDVYLYVFARFVTHRSL